MEERAFWEIIDASRPSGGDVHDHAAALQERLKPLGAQEIISFDQHLSTQLVRAYSWDLWAAAYIINGGCSDDGFEYFRGWLILQGQQVFERALREPDSLAEVVSEPDVEGEDVLYAPLHAYEAITGEELPHTGPKHPADPSGQSWEESDLEARFPRLTAVFG